MSQAPLAQSADKKELFSRLALSEQMHRLLLDDAQVARDRLSSSRQNLTDQSKVNQTVQAPFKWDEISETAKHREILAIVASASPYTKPYYNYGRYRTNVNEENWVARWYLWHSFRYRDNRDSRSKTGPNGGIHAPAVTTTQYVNGNGYWDPVHNCYRR